MQFGILAAALSYLALLFIGALLVMSHLVRGHRRDLRGDLLSLQTRLQETDRRQDRLFDEIESLRGRIHASETHGWIADVVRRQRIEAPETVETPEIPDSKPSGRTVYDHLMADDDPDVS